ncbi:GntR family transcriptional regulator [Enemella dayhoffiae]|uniref:GntR family transcriptional regulator n=1 Tax=Enemella dayhoffiae TaxID=2016507 RepID=A0A255GSK5_9ACTN|nr:PLP-dependent aminotransferase family protein [Enemella dayhoffiae]OYO18571.1 GntR family transcriptional regulator [Enemella dayhoffiae]
MNRAKVGVIDESKRSPAAPSGLDFLQLDPAARPDGVGVTDWLTGELRAAIDDGRLPVGSRLPPTRELADGLGLSRGVVTEAYRRLGDEGRIRGRGRAGTLIEAAARTATGAAQPRPDAPDRAAFFDRAPAAGLVDDLRELPARIDLAPGRPDLTAFPRAAWLRAERAVLEELPAPLLGYPDPRGTRELRAAVAGWLARFRGIVADPGELIIVAGVAQSLTLLAQLLHRDGVTRFAVEDPGSLGARGALRAWGLATPPVPIDDDGPDIAALEASGAAAVLVTPAHQFPTGVAMAPERRHALLDWARRTGGLIVEDDYDAEHRYDRAPVSALRCLDPDLVCYTGSVSKTLSPALRIGWLLPPARMRDRLAVLKRDTDLGNATLPQLVLARLITSGALERQLRHLRRQQQRRRDAMIEAIERHLPHAEVHGAAAGVHLTITLPSGTDDVALAAAALERGVKVHPLSWHTQLPGRPGLVLGYAATAGAVIDEGIGLVGEAYAEQAVG